MKPTRREFVQMSAAAGVAAMFLRRGRAHAAFAMSPELMKFKERLRMFGTDIPVADRSGADRYGADYFEIAMRQFEDKLHPDLPPTTLWGYGNTADSTFRHLGGAIIARSGTPVRVQWSNELPADHPLPVDMSVVSPYLGVGDPAENRVAPHLHGGLVPWTSDGGPFSWFSPGGAVKGPSVIPWLPDGSGKLTDDYWYPEQPEREDDVVPRPRGGHHAAKCLRWPRDRIPPWGRGRGRSDGRTRHLRGPADSAGRPGQGVQSEGSSGIQTSTTRSSSRWAWRRASQRRRSCPSSGATQCW